MPVKSNRLSVVTAQTGGTTGTTGTALSQGRKSLKNAAALDKHYFKGDPLNPSYAIDADSEGITAAVDRSDDGLTAIELGKKYKEMFGTVQYVIINICGTMFEDFKKPLKLPQGTVEAYDMLKEQNVTVLLTTNTWKTSKSSMVERMQEAQLDVELENIYTSSDVCKEYLYNTEKPDYGPIDRPYYLVHQEAYKDFAEEYPRRSNESSVIVGLPSTQFDYRLLSKAMSLLTEGAPLIALNMMKGGITSRNTSLGPGPFIEMLSSCTDAEPIAVCKPSALFYEGLLKKIGCEDNSRAVVIGDDIYEDIQGAKSLGLKAILVRTGRYQLHDEKLLCNNSRPDATAENFVMAARVVMSALAVTQMTDEDFIEEDKSSRGCSEIDSVTLEERLAKKLEGYTKFKDFKSKHSPSVEDPNPLRIPSYIW